jgi:hypothetical protein
MTPELANATLEFMKRVPLKGVEAAAFNSCVAALAAIVNAPPTPLEEDHVDDEGV